MCATQTIDGVKPRESYLVLLVEDDDSFRLALKQSLEVLGYDFEEAVNGGEALAYLSKRRPDIALVDIRMDEMDGVTFLETIRRNHSTLPVVLMSAYEFSPLMVRARAAGFTWFLTKPFSLQQLAESIVRAMADALDPSLRV